MILGRGRSRPLGWYVARTLIPRTVVFLALAAALLVGQAMSVDPLAAPAGDSSAPPAWTPSDATANPGCVPSAAWGTGTPAATLVVYGAGDEHAVRLPFDTAWERNHDEIEVNDVWVVGVCP